MSNQTGSKLRMRKHRARRELEGWRRLDIYVTPALWEALKPHLAGIHCGLSHPGYGIVKLLEKTFVTPEEQKVARNQRNRVTKLG